MKKGKKVLSVLLIVVLLAALGGASYGIYYAVNKHNSPLKPVKSNLSIDGTTFNFKVSEDTIERYTTNKIEFVANEDGSYKINSVPQDELIFAISDLDTNGGDFVNVLEGEGSIVKRNGEVHISRKNIDLTEIEGLDFENLRHDYISKDNERILLDYMEKEKLKGVFYIIELTETDKKGEIQYLESSVSVDTEKNILSVDLKDICESKELKGEKKLGCFVFLITNNNFDNVFEYMVIDFNSKYMK